MDYDKEVTLTVTLPLGTWWGIVEHYENMYEGTGSKSVVVKEIKPKLLNK